MDILGSIAGFVVFLPFALVISTIIAIVDPGPIFYRQERIGKNGKKFLLWKFRTMRVHQPSDVGQLTAGSRDPRITSFGYYLRILKLDEVPQLWNVMKGEMSLVGPRPEVERYVRLYDDRQKRVLQLRPGCTDISVIRGHFHDDALLDDHQHDPEQYYISTIMPRKLDHNLYYLEHQSLLLDLKILTGTMMLLIGIRKNQSVMEGH
ncbi:MAG: glycosyl transferase [Nitrospirales bacterium]|nr:MAG: glycosyl transferase [Nitrospirales bacterium]